MKILVTGGTGFIGNYLVKYLKKKNNEIFVLSRNKKNVDLINSLGAIPLVGDIKDKKFLIKCLTGVDICFHLAAIRSDWGYSWDDYYQANVVFTENLLKASVGKIKHFIYLSSVKAIIPDTPYGKSKLLGEKMALKYFTQQNLPLTIVRPAIVYGPGDDPSGFMNKLISLIMSGKFLIVGSGKNLFQMVYISDLIDALWLAMKEKGKGNVFTIAGKDSVALNNLVSIIKDNLGKNIIPLKIPVCIAKIIGLLTEKLFPYISQKEPIITRNKVRILTESKVYDISKAESLLSYRPKVGCKEGIKIMIQEKKEIYA